MNTTKRFLGIFALTLTLLTAMPDTTVQAQCAMCSLTAENATQHGNNQGKGLNRGIFLLLVMPYLMATGAGILWYKKYRGKKTVKVDDEPIVLN